MEIKTQVAAALIIFVNNHKGVRAPLKTVALNSFLAAISVVHFSDKHMRKLTHTHTYTHVSCGVDPVRVSAKRIIPVFDKLRGSRAFK